MGEPGGLPSMGSHRVGHDWSDLAVAVVKDEWEASRSHWALCLACRDWPVKHRAAAVVMVMLVQQQHRLFKYFLVSFLPCRACSPWGQLLRALWWDQAGHGEMACPQMPHLRLCGLKMMPAIAVNKGCPAIINRSHPRWWALRELRKETKAPTISHTYTCHHLHLPPKVQFEETRGVKAQGTGPRWLRCLSKEWFQWAQVLAPSHTQKKARKFPGSSVVKTLCFRSKFRFDSGSGH